MEIKIKDAIKIAKEFAREIEASNTPNSERVEEVQICESDEFNGKKIWKITLGWTETEYKEAGGKGGGILGHHNSATIEALPRYYKEFQIDSDSGEVLRMVMK